MEEGTKSSLKNNGGEGGFPGKIDGGGGETVCGDLILSAVI